MPEGDTIHRSAAALRIALVGKKMLRFEAPRLVGAAPRAGRTIEAVEATGKHLEITFDDGLILHTHMKMSGSWHLYREGEAWRKTNEHLRAMLTTESWTAVCFDAPIVETYRQRDPSRHPRFGGLGPDLCRADADLERCVELVMTFDEPDMSIAEVMLDQRIFCGVGNVYRCEVLWIAELSPFARVGDLRVSDATRLVNTAASLLRANLRQASRVTVPGVPGGLAVYGRNGQRCSRCADTIEVRRHGGHQRLLYWCPGCQLRLDPRAELGDVTPPQARRPAHDLPTEAITRPVPREHPIEQRAIENLPWRRRSG